MGARSHQVMEQVKTPCFFHTHELIVLPTFQEIGRLPCWRCALCGNKLGTSNTRQFSRYLVLQSLLPGSLLFGFRHGAKERSTLLLQWVGPSQLLFQSKTRLCSNRTTAQIQGASVPWRCPSLCWPCQRLDGQLHSQPDPP